ncbi:MAG TPA: riboflavin synthase [Vicinamibacterales bacterium]|jgi:riboflavin synthase|nr:riboflavin synthase [Vicinamibacterales bacterium]
MFTGIIETVGEVAEVKPTPAGIRLRLTTELSRELEPGDSLAVNGVCLTVVSADAAGVHMDVSPETLRVSSLGTLKRGSGVNLERPLRADGRVDGHFVQGHVDATGTIEELRQEGDSWWVTVKYPSSLSAHIVRKGSITVDGISLTVAGVDDRRFDVQIIPFTWDHTNLKFAKVNDLVNLESDMLGKYVLRAMEIAKRQLTS